MITFLFFSLMLYVFGKLFIFGIKAAWGLVKILSICLFLPIILIALAVLGVYYLLIPALIIAAVVMILKKAEEYYSEA